MYEDNENNCEMEIKNKIVEIKNLSHRYSREWAIKDINFDIEQKGVFALLGSNGAGKSTTMNIICNVLAQTQGNVFINGINLKSNHKEAKKQIGFLPQKAPLHMDMNVDEYLYHCASIRKMAKKEIPNAVERVKEICDLKEYSKRLISNLSGGYQQRVGIAQAIIHNPKFVILDEPTNGLDPNQILAVRKIIRDIARERAVLISTHILSEVEAVCDSIMMIEHGNIVFKGTIQEFQSYLLPSVLVMVLHNAPDDKEWMAIKGVERIERLTRTRIRLHFDGDQSILGRVIRKSCEQEWDMKEIFLEKTSLDKVFAKLSGIILK